MGRAVTVLTIYATAVMVIIYTCSKCSDGLAATATASVWCYLTVALYIISKRIAVAYTRDVRYRSILIDVSLRLLCRWLAIPYSKFCCLPPWHLEQHKLATFPPSRNTDREVNSYVLNPPTL